MEIIGHRGCAEQYPENTVRAVTRSSRVLDAVEMDIRRCGTGELVVFHDETVDRLTEASGAIADLPWETVRDLEVRDSGEPIPRLETVLDAVPDGIQVQLELKATGLATDVRDVSAGYDLDVSVSSFLPPVVETVRDLDWDVRLGLLFDDEPAVNLDRAVDLECSTVHPHYELCLTTDVVDEAHDRGLDVVAWKAARTPEEIAALRAAGVDGVTADRWDIV